MNDLILPGEISKRYPAFQSYFLEALGAFDKINSWEDLKRRFLMGAGLSPNTYDSYTESIKQLFEFLEQKHPLQVTPADIEAFYDNLLEHVGRNTACLRIAGIKRFYKNICEKFPFYQSPFDVMSKKLLRKLGKIKKTRQKKALSKAELRQLLDFLKCDTSLKGIQNYALIMFLVTTGLRAFELCSLQWKNVEYYEDSYTINYIGKGSKPADTELMPEVYRLAFEAFRLQFRRDPHPDDHVFYSLSNYPGKIPTSLTKPVLWKRINAIGQRAVNHGIIKRDLQWSAHLFRRSGCTLLFKETHDIKLTQGFSRHSNVETLLKHYVDSEQPVSPIFREILGVTS